jgi:metal-sulfur cluster biosynthetic enzyme
MSFEIIKTICRHFKVIQLQLKMILSKMDLIYDINVNFTLNKFYTIKNGSIIKYITNRRRCN